MDTWTLGEKSGKVGHKDTEEKTGRFANRRTLGRQEDRWTRGQEDRWTRGHMELAQLREVS